MDEKVIFEISFSVKGLDNFKVDSFNFILIKKKRERERLEEKKIMKVIYKEKRDKYSRK